MVTLTINEITLNATRAALDERVKRLESVVSLWQGIRDQTTPNYLPTEDAQRALVWNIAALHETRMAVEFYAEVEPVEDHPEDATWTDREGQPEFSGVFR